MDIGEAEVAPLVFVGQARVIEPQGVEDRRVEVMDVDRIADDVVAEV
ncbi:MAG: hypothetical protein RIR52_76, partial [Acidobacteriota bacterium]